MDEVAEPAYQLLAPEQFNEEHNAYLDQFERAARLIADQTGLMVGAKNIFMQHMMSTSDCARRIEDMKGDTVDEDRRLLRIRDVTRRLTVLSIYSLEDETYALTIEKRLLVHAPSRSILGTVYHAIRMANSGLVSLLPNFLLEFDTHPVSIGQSGATAGASEGKAAVQLSEREVEVCFLIVLNWNCRQIADFLNRFHPARSARTVDAVYKYRNRICDKFGVEEYSNAALKSVLLKRGLHRTMPRFFLQHLCGSSVIAEA